MFRLVERGDFTSESRYGYITTTHFSAYSVMIATIQGIISWFMPPSVYRATLYCESLNGLDMVNSKASCKMHFVVKHSLAAIPHVSSSR